jgi:hypothetical protein
MDSKKIILLKNFKTQFKTGKTLVYNNLLIVPVLSPQYDKPEYIVQDTALNNACLTIEEISESGSVPYLKAINRCKTKVLLPEGEEIKGAKQNRTFNTSLLLPEDSETIIPVSCTEQGRWQYNSEKFDKTDSWIPVELRMKKNRSVTKEIILNESFHSNQRELWDSIDVFSINAGFRSQTGALRDILDKKNNDITEILKKFPIQTNQTGIVVFVNGKLKGMDVITNSKAFEHLYPKILKSYIASELIDVNKKYEENFLDLKIKKEYDYTQVNDKILNFIDLAIMGKIFETKSPGLGNDIRIQATNVNGFALEYQEKIIHLNLLRNDENEKNKIKITFGDIY